MAARLNTFAGRVILIGLVIHAVLLPLLFYHAWQLMVAGVVRGSPLVARLQRIEGSDHSRINGPAG